jgi:hypothetical protein
MTRTFAFLIATALSAMSLSNAKPSAAESSARPIASEDPRIATKDDVVGAWERVPLPPGANSIEPWPLPYQYFAMTADGRIAWMMTSEKQKNIASKELLQLMDHASGTTTSGLLVAG